MILSRGAKVGDEVELYAIGERIQVVGDSYAQPSTDARRLVRLKPCTKGKVLGFRGTSLQTRWYFVELLFPNPVRGWIPAEAVRFEGDCFADGQ